MRLFLMALDPVQFVAMSQGLGLSGEVSLNDTELERRPHTPPIDEIPQLDDVETYEYECASYCSPNGCMGHTTDIPVSITLDGISFVVDGYEGGDYPSSYDKAKIEEVKNVVERLRHALTLAWKYQDLDR